MGLAAADNSMTRSLSCVGTMAPSIGDDANQLINMSLSNLANQAWGVSSEDLRLHKCLEMSAHLAWKDANAKSYQDSVGIL